MKEETLSKRWHDLDALRGFAMLLGIALHAAMSFLGGVWSVNDIRAGSEFFWWLVLGIHGFRMQLFFLLSGFFTSMVWKKRGLNELVWHRFKRIFLPLLICFVTIIPLMNWVSEEAAVSEYEKTQNIEDIWTPIFTENTKGVEYAISMGADINVRGDEANTPLHLAALLGNHEIIKVLLEAGAQPDPLNVKDETPLVLAVFAGSTKSADVLINYGANDLRTLGQTWDDLFWFNWAGNELDDSKKDKDIKSWLNQFHHLWFLWFLCWMVAGFCIVSIVLQTIRPVIKNTPDFKLQLIWLLLPASLLMQLKMGDGGNYASFGPDTFTEFFPPAHLLIYYGLFFAFGSITFGIRTKKSEPLIDHLGKRWYVLLPITVIGILPLGLGATFEGDSWFIASLLQILYAWGMSIGLIGLFRKLFAKERNSVRYLSDASYWMYIAHLPLVISAQWLFRDWEIFSFLKFFLICISISPILLASYQLFVRYTPIGTLLNGKRKRKPENSSPIIS
jgi:hypothetical protein|tara:strand:+ start:387 stop:1898 length:1512 start_codon:yes stop_codon:yes gene_type:complete